MAGFSCFLIILVAGGLLKADEISLSATLDKNEIAFEGKINLSLEVKWEGDITDYSFGVMPLPETRNLQVAGTRSTISSVDEDGREMTVRAFDYTFKPTQAGTGIIYPIIFDYISWPDSIPGELTSQQFEVAIAPPLPPPEESDSSLLSTVVIVVLATIVVVILVYVFIRLRKARVTGEPALSVERQFLDELSVIKKESQIDRKVFFTRLYKLLTDYMERKYDLHLSGRMAQNILADLDRLDISGDAKDKIGGWLKQADKEKFAPSAGTPGDIIRLISEMEDYFTKLDSQNKSEAS